MATNDLDSKDRKKNVKFQENVNSESENEFEGRQFNKFQFLDMIENQGEENEDDLNLQTDSDDHDNEDTKQKNRMAIDDKNKSTSVKTANNNRSRKRRNKNKANKKAQQSLIDDDLDKLIEQVNSAEKIINANEKRSNVDENDQKTNTSNFNSNESHIQLLKLDMRNLIPENELKRMFGKSVLKEDRSKDQKSRHFYPTSAGSQRSKFVSSAYHDSRLSQFNSGLKMELDELLNGNKLGNANLKITNKKESGDNKNKKGSSVQKCNRTMVQDKNIIDNNNQPIYFRFVHDKAYQVAQLNFLEAAHYGNSEVIINNLHTYPTHVESLIQLSDMIKISEDYKAASDLIERALFIFERGFHQKFNLSQANCRLTYRRPENRTFFITFFKHINYTNRRGLRRTPLEYTKLLLSLDPENDPLFATLLIDFFAIRSEEYDYLIEFHSKWKHLSKLPNMNFSIALAYYLKSKNSKEGKQANEKNLRIADECLQKALIRYPNFIIPLLDACLAEPSSELKKCNYFDYSVYSNKYKTVPESIDILVSLYVQRNNLLWKTKHVLSWLERNVADLVDQFVNMKIIDEGQQIEYWKSFQGPTPRNLLRHLVLSDLKVKIPPSAANTTILDIDPYPPESIYSYNIKVRNGVSSTASTNIQNNLGSLGFSSLFLRSMLPSFSLNDQTTENTSSQPTNAVASGPSSGPSSTNITGGPSIAENQQSDNADIGHNLDPVQNSILNVLSSLSNLLTGVENRQAEENAEGEHHQDDERNQQQ